MDVQLGTNGMEFEGVLRRIPSDKRQPGTLELQRPCSVAIRKVGSLIVVQGRQVGEANRLPAANIENQGHRPGRWEGDRAQLSRRRIERHARKHQRRGRAGGKELVASADEIETNHRRQIAAQPQLIRPRLNRTVETGMPEGADRIPPASAPLVHQKPQRTERAVEGADPEAFPPIGSGRQRQERRVDQGIGARRNRHRTGARTGPVDRGTRETFHGFSPLTVEGDA